MPIDTRTAVLALLVVSAAALFVRIAVAVRATARTAAPDAVTTIRTPSLLQIAIGFGTNFFDTLGIGSFATTTALYRFFGQVHDELIPGTMLVGHALPMVLQVFIFIGIVAVDAGQLALLVAGCVLGGWIGAGFVTRWSRHRIQRAMGIALLVAAAFMALANLQLLPLNGTALTLSPARLVIALCVNTLFGALLTIGIGNYGPSLVLFNLLGLEPKAAFPVMMGSGGFVAMLAGIRFVNRARYHGQAALGLTIGGVPGVLAAAYLVGSLPIAILRWMVVVVVIYAAYSMLRAAAEAAGGAPAGSSESVGV